jgi:hypothetical protein
MQVQPESNFTMSTDAESAELQGPMMRSVGGGGIRSGWSLVQDPAGTVMCTRANSKSIERLNLASLLCV